jgi:hypothetical protein
MYVWRGGKRQYSESKGYHLDATETKGELRHHPSLHELVIWCERAWKLKPKYSELHSTFICNVLVDHTVALLASMTHAHRMHMIPN